MKQINTVLQNVRTDLNHNINKNVRTFTSEGKKMIVYQLNIPELHYLKMPVQFRSLAPDQKQDVLSALLTLNTRMQQEILNEWAMTCQKADPVIRNPTGYLLRLISKAQQGYFRPNSGVNVRYITESELKEEYKPPKTTEQPTTPKGTTKLNSEKMTQEERRKRAEPWIKKLKKSLKMPQSPKE